MSSFPEAVSEKRMCLLCQLVFVGHMKCCPSDGTPLVIMADPLVGTVLPQGYKLIDQIGRGAMGSVYRAVDSDGEEVAVKVLHRSLVNDLEPVKRFTREAQLSSQLSHRNIVSVDDYGVLDDGRPYMVMDLIQGIGVDTIVDREGPFSLERALPIFIQLAQALGHAHDKQIVHRDIKLSNIMLVSNAGQPDVVKVVDFGIAKVWHDDSSIAHLEESLTAAGQVVGSPLYMSPEQCLGQPLDNRTDIYSLGCVMHYMLMGEPLFTAPSVMDLMQQQISKTPRVVNVQSASSAASVAIQKIILDCLHKMPEDRFQSMQDVCAELEHAADLLAGNASAIVTRPSIRRVA